MKPCANTTQICSWQLWACTTILVFSALLPRLPALEEYLGSCSPPPSSLPLLSSQKGEARYSPNSCKREQRLQRRSGSDPPRGPCALPGAESRGPGGCARRRGAARSSAALLCPPASRRRRQLSGGSGAGAGGAVRPTPGVGPHGLLFWGCTRRGCESWPPWGDRRKDGKNASL